MKRFWEKARQADPQARRARHVADPACTLNEELERAEREEKTLRPAANSEERVKQYVVFGELSKTPEVREHLLGIADSHPPAELTGSISSVRVEFHGDGGVFLQVHGYEPRETRRTWIAAAVTLSGITVASWIDDQPLEPADVVIQTPTGPVRLVERTSTPAPGFERPSVYRSPTGRAPSEPIPQEFPTVVNQPAWEHQTRVGQPPVTGFEPPEDFAGTAW